MTSRQAGKRIGTVAASRRKRKIGRGGARQMAGNQKLCPKEWQQLARLVACGSIFVLLVAAKLLLPTQTARFNAKLSEAMSRNMDVQAVFKAVGHSFSEGTGVGDAVEEVYQAVFHSETGEAVQAALPISIEDQALNTLRKYRAEKPSAEPEEAAAPTEEPATVQADTLAYVLYSDKNLPENVSMEQAILDFSYCTPVSGALSSGFGYREHPMEGEERFHYGVDLAADTGTAVNCFADGTVTAVGESSSYGKYCIVTHSSGYSTLYAHCSRIIASSGTAVTEGQKIAEVGETGMATGPHLHFELHCDDTYLNPIYYVKPA